MFQMITRTAETAYKGGVVIQRNMHFVFVLLAEVGKMDNKIQQMSANVNTNL